MPLLNFYPGPSKIYPQVGEIYKQAIESGVFEYNHRSPQFAELFDFTLAQLRDKLAIPADYDICFVSSATESWQVILQSFVKQNSFHLYNGAFGEKWKSVALSLGLQSTGFDFGCEAEIDIDALRLPGSTELIALTQNETSNGTAVSNATLKQLRDKYSEELIAVDATSSMAGVILDWKNADIWFSSVQKCFGLPAGMCVMITSPKAIERAKHINSQQYYNSFVSMLKNSEKSQTTHTPAIPQIYLLGKVLEQQQDIVKVDQMITDRARLFYTFCKQLNGLQVYVKNEAALSSTVICLSGDESIITSLKEKSLEENILLGSGYGDLKMNTVRIANFPAIPDEDFKILKDFLTNFDK